MTSHSVGNFIIPTDEIIRNPSFFRGVGIPPTRFNWDVFCHVWVSSLDATVLIDLVFLC